MRAGMNIIECMSRSAKAVTRALYRTAAILPKLIIALAVLIIALPPAQAQAGTMQWTVVSTPDGSENIVVSPSAIHAFSLSPDGITVFAADIAAGKLYRSKNGGYQWDDISARLSGAGASLPVWDIVVASDNPSLVAAVTSSAGLPRAVYVSTNGGDTWQNSGLMAAADIGTLDISPNYGTCDILAGTRNGAGGGRLYVAKLPGGGGWSEQGLSGDVLAARFSPSYNGDSSLIAVTADAAGTFLNLGIRDTAANTTTWSTWSPQEITVSGGGTSPKAGQINVAGLELPSDFNGQAPSQRRFYVSTDAPGVSASGIYRFDDTIAYHILEASASRRISSIAYYGSYGSGKLLAGEVQGDPSTAEVPVWFTDAPLVCPDTCWYRSEKPPTGAAATGYGNAQVAWSADGRSACAATSSADLETVGWPTAYLSDAALDESAFSRSEDNGFSFNQLGLIDTAISALADVAPTVYSDVLYLASVNTNAGFTGFDSVWKSVGYPAQRAWERVFCLLASNNDTIVRLSPEPENYSIFVGDRLSNDLYESRNRGGIWNAVLPGVSISDFTPAFVSGTPRLYVLDNASVRTGTFQGTSWKWGSVAGTQLNSGHSIAALNDGRVVVGDAGGGMAAYSLNGGDDFIRLGAVQTPGNMHVALDPRFVNNTVIYAASDAASGKLYGINVAVGTSWIDLQAPDRSFYGLAATGTFYGVWSSAGASGVDRTLNAEQGPPLIEWDTMTADLPVGVLFTREPSALKFSGSVDLWAIDNRPYTASTGRLWTYCDCLAPGPYPPTPPADRERLLQSPTLSSPSDDTVITGADRSIEQIEFRWKHPTPAAGYDLWIASDPAFNDVVVEESVRPEIPNAPQWTLTSPANILEAGQTYYWRVRVNRDATYARNNGAWSEARSFTLEGTPQPPSPPPGPTLFSPVNGAGDISPSPTFTWAPLAGATQYELTLYSNAALQELVESVLTPDTMYPYDGALTPGTTYYWQVRVVQPFESEPSTVSTFTVIQPPPGTEPYSPLAQLLWLWIVIAVVVAGGVGVGVFLALRRKAG